MPQKKGKKTKRPEPEASNPPFRTVAGVIDEASNVRMGSGFKFERKGPGEYLIRFTPPFNGIPAVGAQLYGSFDPNNPPKNVGGSVRIMGTAPSLLKIETIVGAPAEHKDLRFSFIAIAD
jgi:hypothetical protein